MCNPYLQIPGLYPIANHPKQDWNYHSQNDHYSSQAYGTKTIRMPRGKMLSGSSGSNYMTYARGNKADYDKWAEIGNIGWDWGNVLNYFRKSERINIPPILASESRVLHGTDGYISVTQNDFSTVEPYLKAFEEIGHNILIDYTGFDSLGYSVEMFTADDGIRQSTAATYLQAASDRPNLFVLKNTLARKLIMKGITAIGVEVELPNKNIIKVMAKQEVILSAGVINSPQLLMLSGIGPKNHLIEKGIQLVLDSPNIGQNLHDHLLTPIVFTGLKGIRSIADNIYILTGLSSNAISVLGSAALNQSQEYPDYQADLYPQPAASLMTSVFCSYIVQLEDRICDNLVRRGLLQETTVSYVSLLHPLSRGHLSLENKDPKSSPLYYTGFYSNVDDLEKHARCVEDFIKIVNSTLFKSIGSDIIDLRVSQCYHTTFLSHEYWKCFILNTASTSFHPAGTCAMGPEGWGVVDERLNVRGINKLRVIDASIMPSSVSGNTNMPVIMIAEKASDMIKQDHGYGEEC